MSEQKRNTCEPADGRIKKVRNGTAKYGDDGQKLYESLLQEVKELRQFEKYMCKVIGKMQCEIHELKDNDNCKEPMSSSSARVRGWTVPKW